jgi:hypothetical protein
MEMAAGVVAAAVPTPLVAATAALLAISREPLAAMAAAA